MTSRPELTVAVTGLGSSDLTAPGLGVLRSLRKSGRVGRLIGLAYETLEGGTFEPGLADEVYLLPHPSQGRDAFLWRLADINRRSPFDVLIPNLDTEIPHLVKYQTILAGLGINAFLPDEKGFQVRGKDRLAAWCDDHRITTPRTMVVTGEADLVSAATQIGFPVLVKGIYHNAFLGRSVDEVLQRGRILVGRWGYPLIVQQFVWGRQFHVCALGDGRGVLVGAVPMTRLSLTEKGKVWAGVSVGDLELIEITARLVEALAWRGPLEVEILRAEADGRCYLLQINPRFPAWVYLCQAAGQNLPLDLVRLAAGEKVAPCGQYRAGVRFIRSARELILSPEEFEAIHTSGQITGRGRLQHAV